MSGVNPYLKRNSDPSPARRGFCIEFRVGRESQKVEVNPAEMPSGGAGLPGSILDIALGFEIDIDHACGGVCACSTCHVIVREGLESCSESTEAEEDQLEKAPGLTFQSRLACQTVPNGSSDLVVEVPNWNRNLARE